MAEVFQRVWFGGPRKVKRTAWAYTYERADGRQIRKSCETWSKDDAQAALVAALALTPTAPIVDAGTFGEAVARYLATKARKKSLASDARYLATLLRSFGAETRLTDITASRISAWKAERLAATCPRTQAPYSAATINRPLQALRHLLKLAHDEWEIVPTVPKIRLEKEPEGRVRWLEPDEEARLLDACRASRSPYLADLVAMALETGMRKTELVELTWPQIDLSRGVIRLEGRGTKSAKRRDVHMRQIVYRILARRAERHVGRVWPVRKIRTAFENAVALAGLEDFVFHDCRHHFASWFMMRGGSLQALKEILGHKDIKTTLIYAHLAPEHLRQEMAKTERPTSEETSEKITWRSHGAVRDEAPWDASPVTP